MCVTCVRSITAGPKGVPTHHLWRVNNIAVRELRQLYYGVEMVIDGRPQQVQALLCNCSMDAPALRASLHFAGIKSDANKSTTHLCTKCDAHFGMPGDFWMKDKFKPRTVEQHILHGHEWLGAGNLELKKLWVKQYGFRYNPFNDLPYFDSIKFHTLDAMHLELLGACKNLLETMQAHRIMCDVDYSVMQARMDRLFPPREIGRIPHRLAANMSGFKADQVHWLWVFLWRGDTFVVTCV